MPLAPKPKETIKLRKRKIRRGGRDCYKAVTTEGLLYHFKNGTLQSYLEDKRKTCDNYLNSIMQIQEDVEFTTKNPIIMSGLEQFNTGKHIYSDCLKKYKAKALVEGVTDVNQYATNACVDIYLQDEKASEERKAALTEALKKIADSNLVGGGGRTRRRRRRT